MVLLAVRAVNSVNKGKKRYLGSRHDVSQAPAAAAAISVVVRRVEMVVEVADTSGRDGGGTR
jgi:hypothetical protein